MMTTPVHPIRIFRFSPALGFAAAIAAFSIWGLFPLYLIGLLSVSATANRRADGASSAPKSTDSVV